MGSHIQKIRQRNTAETPLVILIKKQHKTKTKKMLKKKMRPMRPGSTRPSCAPRPARGRLRSARRRGRQPRSGSPSAAVALGIVWDERALALLHVGGDPATDEDRGLIFVGIFVPVKHCAVVFLEGALDRALEAVRERLDGRDGRVAVARNGIERVAA